MKRFVQVLILTAVSAAAMLAEVPTNTEVRRGSVHLYISQITSPPIFVVPGVQAGQDYHYFFVVQVWDLADLPVEAFKVTVNYTSASQGRTGSDTHILPRNITPEAVAAGAPVFAVFRLTPDAVITSLLVEELAPVASEQF